MGLNRLDGAGSPVHLGPAPPFQARLGRLKDLQESLLTCLRSRPVRGCGRYLLRSPGRASCTPRAHLIRHQANLDGGQRIQRLTSFGLNRRTPVQHGKMPMHKVHGLISE